MVWGTLVSLNVFECLWCSNSFLWSQIVLIFQSHHNPSTSHISHEVTEYEGINFSIKCSSKSLCSLCFCIYKKTQTFHMHQNLLKHNVQKIYTIKLSVRYRLASGPTIDLKSAWKDFALLSLLSFHHPRHQF